MPEEEKETEQDPIEEKPKAKPKAKPELWPVRLVVRKSESALVEWIDSDGHYQRAFVPADCVKDGMADKKDLEQGIPFGIVWEKYIEIEATPESVANELRRQGAWLLQDINHVVLNHANRAFDAGKFLRRVNLEEANK